MSETSPDELFVDEKIAAFLGILQREKTRFDGIAEKLGYIDRTIEKKEPTTDLEGNRSLTLQQIGQETVRYVSSNPQLAMDAIEALETGVNVQERRNKGCQAV